LREKRVPPACSTWIVAEDISATLAALRRLVFEANTDFPGETDLRRARKSCWCFLTAFVNLDVAEAIDFLGVVGFGEGGRAATWAKVSVGNPVDVNCRISRIERAGIDDSLPFQVQGVDRGLEAERERDLEWGRVESAVRAGLLSTSSSSSFMMVQKILA
jgi:hypothetical protein